MSGRRAYVPLSGMRRFDAVFREGTKVRRGGITVVVARRRQGAPRVGLVAGGRIGGAVVRNRARRRIRAVLDGTELIDGFDYVVIAGGAVAKAPFSVITEWVQGAIELGVARENEEMA